MDRYDEFYEEERLRLMRDLNCFFHWLKDQLEPASNPCETFAAAATLIYQLAIDPANADWDLETFVERMDDAIHLLKQETWFTPDTWITRDGEIETRNPTLCNNGTGEFWISRVERMAKENAEDMVHSVEFPPEGLPRSAEL